MAVQSDKLDFSQPDNGLSRIAEEQRKRLFARNDFKDSNPTTPSQNYLKLFVKDNGSTSALYTIDSLGNVIKDHYVSSVIPTYDDNNNSIYLEPYNGNDSCCLS